MPLPQLVRDVREQEEHSPIATHARLLHHVQSWVAVLHCVPRSVHCLHVVATSRHCASTGHQWHTVSRLSCVHFDDPNDWHVGQLVAFARHENSVGQYPQLGSALHESFPS